MKNLTHVATLVFNQPLMVEPRKLDAIMHVIGSRLGIDEEFIPPKPDASVMGDKKDRKPYSVSKDGIAVIDFSGSLVNRRSFMDSFSGMTSYEQLTYEVMDAATDPDITGILLRFDSPGGEVSGAFDLADLIYSIKDKPVYAAVDDHAYSAAYLMASQADKIFVTQTGGVGSIGVIAQHVDRSEMNKKVGLKYTTIFAGKRKNDLNPNFPLSDEVQERLQGLIDTTYEMFVSAVSRGRGLSAESVISTEADTFNGAKSIIVGLADKIGTFRDALQSISAFVKQQKSTDSGIAASAFAENKEEKEKMADTREVEVKKDAALETAPVEKVVEKPVEKLATVEKAEPAKVVAISDSKASLETILELCVVAGKDAKFAQELHSRGLTQAEVSRELIKDMRASQSTAIDGSVDVSKGNKESLAAFVDPFSKEGVEYHAANAKAFRADPKKYDQYLAANPIQRTNVA